MTKFFSENKRLLTKKQKKGSSTHDLRVEDGSEGSNYVIFRKSAC